MALYTKEQLYEMLKVSPCGKDEFVLLEDFVYEDIVVPKGYKTNGADVPVIFWSLFPPNRPGYLPAAVVHDYLCDLEEYKKADEYFNKMLKELEIITIRRWLMVGSVAGYHYVRYDVLKIK